MRTAVSPARRRQAALRAALAERQAPRLAAAVRRVTDDLGREAIRVVARAESAAGAEAALRHWLTRNMGAPSSGARSTLTIGAARLAGALLPQIKELARQGWDGAGEELGLAGSGDRGPGAGKSLRVFPQASSLKPQAAVAVQASSLKPHAAVAGKAGPALAIPDWNDFVQRGDWPELERWVKTTSQSAIGNRGQDLLRLFEKARDTYEAPETGAGPRGITPADLAREMQRMWPDISQKRAAMLAQTGSVWAYNEGAVQRYAAEGVAVVEWLTAQDDLACPFCADMNGKRVETNDKFFQAGDNFPSEGAGGEPLTMKVWSGWDIKHPPLHPNCRCTLIPVVDAGQLDSAPTELRPKPQPQSPAPKRG
jgi:SPP1 gp7 family putative phage head morphogenesis protein